MKYFKLTGKNLLGKSIIVFLLLANFAAFAVSDSFFTTRLAQAEQESKKDLVSKLNTGWQMLDWSFSLIDYFRSVGERKN